MRREKTYGAFLFPMFAFLILEDLWVQEEQKKCKQQVIELEGSAVIAEALDLR